MTQDNYQLAYNSFVERYSNKRFRAQAQALEKAKPIDISNPTSLRNLLDTFSENVTALKNLRFPTNEWDFVLLNLTLKKLDSNTVTKFELQHGTSEIPKYYDLVKFLNKCCTAYDAIQYSNPKKIVDVNRTI